MDQEYADKDQEYIINEMRISIDNSSKPIIKINNNNNAP